MGIYTGETAISPDGIECAVIDTSRVNFDLAALGRKSAETLVKEAKGGERIETKAPDGRIESVYVAKSGDAIFTIRPTSTCQAVQTAPGGRHRRSPGMATSRCAWTTVWAVLS